MIYFMLELCSDSRFLRIMYILKTVINLVRIIVPILLIVVVMLDITKAIATKDDDVLNEVKKKSLPKVIAALAVFLVPLVVSILMNMVGFTKYNDCFMNVSNDQINEAKANEETMREEEIRKEEEEREQRKNEYNDNNNSNGNNTSYTPTTSLNLTPGIYENEYNGMKYIEIIPEGATTNMPLMVFLHGDPSNGVPLTYAQVKALPTVKKVNEGNLYNSGKYIFIAPMSSTRWSDSRNNPNQYASAYALINNVINKYKSDKSRIYINGFSGGAMATWIILSNYPKFFAAATPISGCINGANYANIATTPVFAKAGSSEDSTSCLKNVMVPNTVNAGGTAKYENIAGASNHGDAHYLYATDQLWNWMLSQKRSDVQSSSGGNLGPSLKVTAGLYHVTDYKENGMTFEYYVNIPEGATENMPIIVHLRGGTNLYSASENEIKTTLPMSAVLNGTAYKYEKFIFLYPKFAVSDPTPYVMPVLNHVIDQYKVNKNRVYLSGASNGGLALYKLIPQNPGIFRATVPVSAPPSVSIAESFKNIPTFALCGTEGNADSSYNPLMRNLVNKINEIGGHAVMASNELEFKILIKNEIGKDITANESKKFHHDNILEFFNKPEIWEWLLKQ